jgi:hypothetical protein
MLTGLAPQPGVHRVRRFLLGKELVALQRPHTTPAIAHDDLVAQRLDQAAARVFE